MDQQRAASDYADLMFAHLENKSSVNYRVSETERGHQHLTQPQQECLISTQDTTQIRRARE